MAIIYNGLTGQAVRPVGHRPDPWMAFGNLGSADFERFLLSVLAFYSKLNFKLVYNTQSDCVPNTVYGVVHVSHKVVYGDIVLKILHKRTH